MDRPQLIPRRGSRLEKLEARLQAGLAYPPAHGIEALGPLRMAGSGIVVTKGRVVVEADPHRGQDEY